MGMTVNERLQATGWAARPAVQLFVAFWRASPGLTVLWWSLLAVGALLPSVFAVLTGQLAGLIAAGDRPRFLLVLIALCACFLVIQVLPQAQAAVSMSIGSWLAWWLNDRLVRASAEPPGLAHLEDPDLAITRDFDRGMGGPPLYLAVEFMRGSLLQLLVGVAAAVVLAWYSWWAALILAAVWASTHWLLRESAVWRDRNTEPVQLARQHAEYAYELAMEPQAAKEVRLFGLHGWVVDRFARQRRGLYDAQYLATRLRERSVAGAAVLVTAGNLAVFGLMGYLAVTGAWSLAHTVAAAQLAGIVQWIAFGGLSWAVDDAASAAVTVNRIEPLLRPAGALPTGSRPPPDPPVEVQLRGVAFRYPRTRREIYSDLSLTIPAGSSLAIVGANGAGKTTLAKLLCRFYDPTAGALLVNGVDLREFDLAAWRGRIAAVFQDFARFERSLRDNVDPGARCTDEQVLTALRDAGAEQVADLAAPMAKGYPDGVDLSGGQWQRVALARVLCGVRSGAGLVILDEPTANLDARGEATVFARLLAETAGTTTILISHRFSTVRLADQIAVLVDGRVAELGSHDQLMAAGGHYRRMFDLQASRFLADRSETGDEYDTLD
jgi:ATP-binding cassette, subfamily B, bacterial